MGAAYPRTVLTRETYVLRRDFCFELRDATHNLFKVFSLFKALFGICEICCENFSFASRIKPRYFGRVIYFIMEPHKFMTVWREFLFFLSLEKTQIFILSRFIVSLRFFAQVSTPFMQLLKNPCET